MSCNVEGVLVVDAVSGSDNGGGDVDDDAAMADDRVLSIVVIVLDNDNGGDAVDDDAPGEQVPLIVVPTPLNKVEFKLSTKLPKPPLLPLQPPPPLPKPMLPNPFKVEPDESDVTLKLLIVSLNPFMDGSNEEER